MLVRRSGLHSLAIAWRFPARTQASVLTIVGNDISMPCMRRLRKGRRLYFDCLTTSWAFW